MAVDLGHGPARGGRELRCAAALRRRALSNGAAGLRALAAACHPGPTTGVTVIAVLLGAGVDLDAGPLAVFGGAVLAGQLSVGWSNDALDAARDASSGRTDKPAAAGAVSTRALWLAAVVAALGTVLLSALLGPGVIQLLLPAAGWAYNLGLKGTWASAAAYAVGFAALPAAPWLALPDHPTPPWWAPLAGALLGIGAHVANVLPDLADDAATGVRGLPHRLGPRRSVLLMGVALAGAVVVTALGPGWSWGALASSAVALAVGGGAVGLAWRRPGSRATFGAVVLLAGVATVQLVLRA